MHPIIENVEITDIGAEGKALARVDEKVVFVTNCIPGDVVDIQIKRKRKKFMEGYVLKYHKLSENRIEPICSHFGTCGGCKWQNLPYKDQLSYKQTQVENQLKRIGKIDLPKVNTIIGSESTEYYRNKLEFTFSNKRWLTNEEIANEIDFHDRDALGFHVPGMFDKVLDLNECFLQKEPSESIRKEVKKYALDNKLSFFDLREQEGLLRNITIRVTSIDEVMVILSFFKEEKNEREALLEHLKNKFPEITSLMFVINSKANDSILDQDIKLYSGRDYIIETLRDLKFRIGPKSFFQTNTAQANKLYDVTKEFAGLTGNEIVYDMYTGTGTIANFIAQDCKQVIGIESVEEAIIDAKVNSKENSIENTSFFAGDIKDLLNKEFIIKQAKPDVIILDPPRVGVHQNVIDALLFAMAEKIVYVSCNPATQARDINLLQEYYKVSKVQPVDMFPHTHHVENVVLLEKIIK